MSPPSLGLVVQIGAQACSSGHGDNSVRSQMRDLTLVGALTFITRARPARAANSSRPISGRVCSPRFQFFSSPGLPPAPRR